MHRCNLPHCDGTQLGHELARDFPEETARIDEAFDRLAQPREGRVMPENLQVCDPTCAPHLHQHCSSECEHNCGCGEPPC